MERDGSIEPYEAVYDTGLPGCRLLQQPKQLAAVLSSLLANSLEGDLRVHIRHHLPGKRCTAAVDVILAPAGERAPEHRRFTIKLYAAGKGAETFETLQQLRSHGFGAGRFTVCRPLAYDPVWRLLILEWARGESLRSRLLVGKDTSRAAKVAAGWLLTLHRCGLTTGRRYDFRRHLHTLGLQGQHLAEIFPEAGRLYGDFLQNIEKRGRPGGWEPAPTHRDFTPEHLFLNGDQLTGLDFDEFCQYDPLFDVAHFIAHLRLMALSRPGAVDGLDQVAKRFQAAYQAGAENYSAPRVRLYHAMAYLKLAYVVGVVERPENWKNVVTALLHEAQRTIW